MQRTLMLVLFASSLALGQPETAQVFVAHGDGGGFQKVTAAPVQGAPYSATITNESVQTLADGNRIVQTSTGTVARDSLGRTRQDAPLPAIGNMMPAKAPHLVFIQDPVAQSSYTLDLTDKTAVKNPGLPGGIVSQGLHVSGPAQAGAALADGPMVAIRGVAATTFDVPLDGRIMSIQAKALGEDAKVQTEDLGSKILEGVNVTGTRSTRTIPAGQIGNDKPISIVTEVWTSPDLKTIVYSKRSDPRIGDQTFQLTNIVRAEPDPSLFTIPSDFKLQDFPGPILYKTSGRTAQ